MSKSIESKAEQRSWSQVDLRDLRRCGVSRQLVSGYRWRSRIARSSVLKLAQRLEGGQFYSFTLREVLDRYYGVHVGAYSYGACLSAGALPAGVTIGRYCSIAAGLQVYLRNHPYNWLSMHPFFYNKECGIVPNDTVAYQTLEIGHDTWIGGNVSITPGCRRIGLGAVVGSAAVVTKDVPDFAIVAGNPAKFIRHRFSEELCETIRRSEWWNQPISACASVLDSMTSSLEEMKQLHPLLQNNKIAASNQGPSSIDQNPIVRS